jgi:hypothetical protein
VTFLFLAGRYSRTRSPSVTPIESIRRFWQASTWLLVSCPLLRAARSRSSGAAAATIRTLRQVSRRWPPTFRSSAASSYAVGVLSPWFLPPRLSLLRWQVAPHCQHNCRLFLWLSAGLDCVNTVDRNAVISTVTSSLHLFHSCVGHLLTLLHYRGNTTMTHHPIVVQALYYCIVAVVPTPQPRKPQTCNNMLFYLSIIRSAYNRKVFPLSSPRLYWVVLIESLPFDVLQIYGTFSRAMLRIIPPLRGYAEPLTNAMVEFYLASQERFTQDMQPHYVYSPREMTRWVRGICEAIR